MYVECLVNVSVHYHGNMFILREFHTKTIDLFSRFILLAFYLETSQKLTMYLLFRDREML